MRERRNDDKQQQAGAQSGQLVFGDPPEECHLDQAAMLWAMSRSLLMASCKPERLS